MSLKAFYLISKICHEATNMEDDVNEG